MTLQETPELPAAGGDATRGILKLAILAVGGQGGGVLTGWVADLARRGGYRAQSTSVAGVAQRTGSTVYYIEMAPDEGRDPVFALNPAPGDVDVVVAAEWMEAGRAMVRGFVTPDRTTLVASTHRVQATIEKIAPADGRLDPAPVLDEARRGAHRAVCLDLERAAREAGSVISASLFGALAGSRALPFDRALFEDTIRASGRGVPASLAAFAAGHDSAAAQLSSPGAAAEVPILRPGAAAPSQEPDEGAAEPAGPAATLADWRALADRVAAMPEPVQATARRGLAKVVDYQDPAYGGAYLDRLDRALDGDGPDWRFSAEAAKYLANAMCYDDLIRVADLKTRPSREARLRRESRIGEEAVVNVTEYFHPRADEVCGTMPAGLGRWVEARPKLFAWLDRRVNRGRRLRTDALSGFVPLWIVASLKPVRRKLLRHHVEEAHLAEWFDRALAERAADYDLGVEVLRCRRLIKGYSDTHARGQTKFARVIGGLELLRGRDDAADWMRRLREAAMQDPDGEALDGALATIRSF